MFGRAYFLKLLFSQAESRAGKEAKELRRSLALLDHLPDLLGLAQLPLTTLEQLKVQVTYKKLQAITGFLLSVVHLF